VGRDPGLGGDHRAHGFRSTESTLLNKEGALDGHLLHAQLARETEKKRRRCDASFATATRTNIRGISNRAAHWVERMGLMRHWSGRLDGLCDGAPAVSLRRSAT
jgi:hypothetical protein